MTGAAFFDLEGTLLRANLVHTLFFYARHQQGISRSLGKSLQTLLAIPLFAAADLHSRRMFNTVLFRMYRGQSEDRLRFFSRKLFDQVLRPSFRAHARELIEQARRGELRPVIVTGALDVSIKPLLEYLQISDFAANRLEFVDGIATGRVLPPVIAGSGKAAWIRQFAERERLSLSESFAYSDSISDLPMLAMVGHPAAVNPDLRLRRLATAERWPILDLH